jgi:hypothetical protein
MKRSVTNGETEQFFRNRSKAAERERFLAFIEGAGDAPPIEGDRLPPAPPGS